MSCHYAVYPPQFLIRSAIADRELPKRPTAIRFTADSQTILVSDKFGDIFSYPFQPIVPSSPKQKRDAYSSHENPSGGQLILGHASLLTAFLLSQDEKFIMTSDRDEHIRISWYPQGFSIEMYCLGHTKFISAIHNPRRNPHDLISGGGDPVLKIWDWMTGAVKHEIRVLNAIEPFLRIHNVKQKSSGDSGAPEGTRRRGGKRRGRRMPDVGAVSGSNVELIVTNVKENSAHGSAADTGVGDIATAKQSHESAQKGEKTLVINKIDTTTSDTGHYILFSAVGATALFASLYPTDASISDIHAFNFEQPVIDFVISDGGLIWVALDGNWADDGLKAPGEQTKMVRVLRLTFGELVEVTHTSELLSSLNTKCLIPATAADLERLDIYANITAMPKNTETEQDDTSEIRPLDEDLPHGKQISKKEIGRLKSKKAVLAKVQERESKYNGDSKTEDNDIKEPETKKTKT